MSAQSAAVGVLAGMVNQVWNARKGFDELVKWEIMDRNDDTMIDLMLGTAGSIIFVLAKTGIFYYKKFNKTKKIKKIKKKK